MGMFDSFWIKAKCPHCGNIDVLEFQTKNLMNCLVIWRQGQKFDKYKRQLIKRAWCPDIKQGIVYNATAGCHSKECTEWQDKEDGYSSGFGRLFEADIKIKDGRVHSVINIRTDDDELEKQREMACRPPKFAG